MQSKHLSFQEFVTVTGEDMTIRDAVMVSRGLAETRLSEDQAVNDRLRRSSEFIHNAVEEGRPVYGVTTGFGGMADVIIPREEVAELQNNLTWFLKAGSGRRLPLEDVRAGMLLRANSLIRGYSGIRRELLSRLALFLNNRVTPLVWDLGSIGASGDLVPLSAVTGALVGLDDSFRVDFDGEEMSSVEALHHLGLPRIRLACKEGLAMMNGTSVMTGIAANNVFLARQMLGLTMGIQGLFLQGLYAKTQSFDPFIHDQKPHPGQIFSAALIRDQLEGSQLVLRGTPKKQQAGMRVIQERYSIRCQAQYLGPIFDALSQVGRQIEVEMNTTNDNPLINPDEGKTYHCGNFLGQYVGVSMDQLRFQLGMAAKHLDVQVATLVAPEFNNGLPASLVGNTKREVNMGLKGLQIAGNSIMPLISYYGAPLVDRYPTHAEQYNQNINSLGFGSANLARQSLELYRRYLAVALIFGVQAVDLRTRVLRGHYDARECLSPPSLQLYEAVREVVGSQPDTRRPYIRNDNEQALDDHLHLISQDIENDGRIVKAVEQITARVTAHKGL